MMKLDALRVTSADVASLFPKLPDRANKGMMGRVLLVCGSYDPKGLSMAGAAYLAAMAAYRIGAGIVEIFTPKENYSVLAALVPEAIFSLYGIDEEPYLVTARVKNAVERADAVCVGCGLGKSDLARALLKSVLESARVPLLIDADGLNILAENKEMWSLISADVLPKTVITPHPGEMSRLCGIGITDILRAPESVACDFASEKGIVCLLKDHNTVISDGKCTYINNSGNPGMATAGMGDVLAGVIAALLARVDLTAENGILLSAAVGAHIHGRAGDLASERCGQYSLTARELLSEFDSAIE